MDAQFGGQAAETLDAQGGLVGLAAFEGLPHVAVVAFVGGDDRLRFRRDGEFIQAGQQGCPLGQRVVEQGVVGVKENAFVLFLQNDQ